MAYSNTLQLQVSDPAEREIRKCRREAAKYRHKALDNIKPLPTP